jgi:hypothetical protein
LITFSLPRHGIPLVDSPSRTFSVPSLDSLSNPSVSASVKELTASSTLALQQEESIVDRVRGEKRKIRDLKIKKAQDEKEC